MEDLLYPIVAVIAFLTGRFSLRFRRRRRKPRLGDGTSAYQAYKEKQ
jgi:hypothetical protein